MLFESETLWNLHGGPQLVLAARRLRIGRSKNHMPGEGILPKHVIKCRLKLFGRHFPGHQRSLREVRRQERLADPPNRSRAQHSLDPVQDQPLVDPGKPGNFPERFANKSLDLVFRDSEDFGVDGICVLGGDHVRNVRLLFSKNLLFRALETRSDTVRERKKKEDRNDRHSCPFFRLVNSRSLSRLSRPSECGSLLRPHRRKPFHHRSCRFWQL